MLQAGLDISFSHVCTIAIEPGTKGRTSMTCLLLLPGVFAREPGMISSHVPLPCDSAPYLRQKASRVFPSLLILIILSFTVRASPGACSSRNSDGVHFLLARLHRERQEKTGLAWTSPSSLFEFRTPGDPGSTSVHCIFIEGQTFFKKGISSGMRGRGKPT